ncbi:hypothetical protein BBJ28_00025686, partial [Nothophytophthora sp. Chile5]
GRVAVPIDRRVDDTSNQAGDVMCKYKSTRCMLPRTRKSNGQLHNLCELHRERANEVQGRFEARKRLRQQQAGGAEQLPDMMHSDFLEPIRASDSSELLPDFEEWEIELLLHNTRDSE